VDEVGAKAMSGRVRAGYSRHVILPSDADQAQIGLTPEALNRLRDSALPLRPHADPHAAPSRSAAAQRRAMQAAIAAAVRAMRSSDRRRMDWQSRL
jgi:hypothetical protein